jgi:hypothetical protein
MLLERLRQWSTPGAWSNSSGTTVFRVEGPILCRSIGSRGLQCSKMLFDLDDRLGAQLDPVLNWTWLLRHFRW